MPRVLLLLPTTTYRAQAFMDAAARLGVDVTVASEQPSTVAGLNPAGLLTIDFTRPSDAALQVRGFADRHPIAAVIAVDDQAVAVGAAICETLGLPANPVDSALAARDKSRMRTRLALAGIPQPQFRLASFDEPLDRLARELEYPCVIKPLALAASQGVIRADSALEFTAAAARLERIVNNAPHGAGPEPAGGTVQSRFLIEQFVAGPEIAVEGLLTRGRLRILTIFDKPDPLDGPYFEETIYITPTRLSAAVQAEIAACTERACRALGLVHGPVHAELRLTPCAGASPEERRTTPVVIEVNARSIGGLCSRVLRFGTGLSLEELIIRHAIDADASLPLLDRGSAGVMMLPIPRGGVFRSVRGLDAARRSGNIEDVVITVRPGQRLVPLPEGSVYLGFMFARAGSSAEAEAALREAHRQLEFEIEAVEDP